MAERHTRDGVSHELEDEEALLRTCVHKMSWAAPVYTNARLTVPREKKTRWKGEAKEPMP